MLCSQVINPSTPNRAEKEREMERDVVLLLLGLYDLWFRCQGVSQVDRCVSTSLSIWCWICDSRSISSGIVAVLYLDRPTTATISNPVQDFLKIPVCDNSIPS